MANHGDVAHFGIKTKHVDINKCVNAEALSMVVWPWVDEREDAGGQIQNKENPEADYQYFFWLEGPSQARTREKFSLRRKHYSPVTTDEFDVRNFDAGPDKIVRFGEFQLWARPARYYFEELEARQKQGKAQIDAEMEGALADAEKLGVGVETVVAGQRKVLTKPRKQLYQS